MCYEWNKLCSGTLVDFWMMLDCSALMEERLVTRRGMRTRREMKEDKIKRDKMERS